MIEKNRKNNCTCKAPNSSQRNGKLANKVVLIPVKARFHFIFLRNWLRNRVAIKVILYSLVGWPQT